METDASKDNNNFLLLLILPIYAVIVGGAIDFSPLSNSNKKKEVRQLIYKYYVNER
jgi:hypothetical protein